MQKLAPPGRSWAPGGKLRPLPTSGIAGMTRSPGNFLPADPARGSPGGSAGSGRSGRCQGLYQRRGTLRKTDLPPRPAPSPGAALPRRRRAVARGPGRSLLSEDGLGLDPGRPHLVVLDDEMQVQVVVLGVERSEERRV